MALAGYAATVPFAISIVYVCAYPQALVRFHPAIRPSNRSQPTEHLGVFLRPTVQHEPTEQEKKAHAVASALTQLHHIHQSEVADMLHHHKMIVTETGPNAHQNEAPIKLYGGHLDRRGSHLMRPGEADDADPHIPVGTGVKAARARTGSAATSGGKSRQKGRRTKPKSKYETGLSITSRAAPGKRPMPKSALVGGGYGSPTRAVDHIEVGLGGPRTFAEITGMRDADAEPDRSWADAVVVDTVSATLSPNHYLEEGLFARELEGMEGGSPERPQTEEGQFGDSLMLGLDGGGSGEGRGGAKGGGEETGSGVTERVSLFGESVQGATEHSPYDMQLMLKRPAKVKSKAWTDQFTTTGSGSRLSPLARPSSAPSGNLHDTSLGYNIGPWTPRYEQVMTRKVLRQQERVDHFVEMIQGKEDRELMWRHAKERRICQTEWLMIMRTVVTTFMLGSTLKLGRARRTARRKRKIECAAARKIEVWYLRLRLKFKLKKHQDSLTALKNFIRRWTWVHRRKKKIQSLSIVANFLTCSKQQGKCLRGLKKFKKHVQILQRSAYDFLACRRARLHVLNLKLAAVEVEKQQELAYKRHHLEKEAQQALKMSSTFNRIASRLQHSSSQVKKVLDAAAERATRKGRIGVHPDQAGSKKQGTLVPPHRRMSLLEQLLREQRRRHIMDEEEAFHRARAQQDVFDVEDVRRLISLNLNTVQGHRTEEAIELSHYFKVGRQSGVKPIADRRPLTADRRPLTADRRPPQEPPPVVSSLRPLVPLQHHLTAPCDLTAPTLANPTAGAGALDAVSIADSGR